LAQAVADGLGIPLPPPQPLALERRPKSEIKASQALSLFARPGDGTVRARRIAILVAAGVASASLKTLHTTLLEAGAVPRFVGPRLGSVAVDEGDAIDVEVTIEAAPSVLWDALVIPDGAGAIEILKANGQALEFVKDQYRHCKTILALGSGAELLEAAMIPAELPDGEPDPGILRLDGDDVEEAGASFTAAVAKHRHFERQTDPPRV
jgi:catalase